MSLNGKKHCDILILSLPQSTLPINPGVPYQGLDGWVFSVRVKPGPNPLFNPELYRMAITRAI